MKVLWALSRKILQGKPLRKQKKLFLLLNSAEAGLAGLLLWLVIRRFGLASPDWMVCFAGYPIVFYGLIGGVIFLMNLNDREE